MDVRCAGGTKEYSKPCREAVCSPFVSIRARAVAPVLLYSGSCWRKEIPVLRAYQTILALVVLTCGLLSPALAEDTPSGTVYGRPHRRLQIIRPALAEDTPSGTVSLRST